ncbi:MAG TPA: penicillin-binding transpeptidase domain-containing protein [Anaeromyxobacteraceae bacterium]|nr:penicillin-binding transpeptidase domain-containing protein [Anaeromyxobacteraceae bacterium]
MDPRRARWIALRMGFLGLLLAAALAVVLLRAVQLQVLQGDRLGGLARDQYLRQLELKPQRGVIADRNGVPLAASAEADSVFLDPRDFRAGPRPAAALGRLARVLSVDPKALERRLERGGRFAWVKRRISPAESEAVRGLQLAGVGLVKEARRYYPRRELAGQVLGLVGDDGAGLEGVEYALDDALQGEPMRVPTLRDARGLHLLGEAPAPERVLAGARVELTIDQGLQHAAERALSEAVAQARAASGMAVAVDPRSGEILALANVPVWNPNSPGRGDQMRNRAVLDTFEPGSTAKVFAVAGALDAGAIRPLEPIFCENGAWAVGDHVVHDHKAMGWTGPSRILSVSSNIGAAKIAQRLGRERLQRTLLAFGFGERTQLGLSGEPRGQVPFPRAEVSLATMAFGQGFTATGLQMTMAMAAVAGGGTLMRPWLVKRVVDPASGRVLSEAAPTPVRRAVSPEVAAMVSRWLEGVIADPDGTGRRARLEGWRAAGKTGTAQKADPVSGGYSADKHFSSFVGFAPAGAPRVVVGVFVDEPKGEIYGGEVAAPVFKTIAEYALKALAVPASEAVARSPAPPRSELAQERPGPPPLEAAPRRPVRGSGVAVPSLEGLSARTALRALEAVDLGADLEGSGRVTRQSPRPGEVVERGARVQLTLAPPRG